MKITLTIDCPTVQPGTHDALVLLNAVEGAWDRGRWALTDAADKKNISHILYGVDRWWFNCEGGETRYMPEDQPGAVEGNLELKAALLRFWINEPILRHAMLLYREACTSDTSVKISKDVQQDIKTLHKMAAEICGLPKD